MPERRYVNGDRNFVGLGLLLEAFEVSWLYLSPWKLRTNTLSIMNQNAAVEEPLVQLSQMNSKARNDPPIAWTTHKRRARRITRAERICRSDLSAPGPHTVVELGQDGGKKRLSACETGFEEKFRVYLLEQEQELQDRLEEEFRQKEELRAADFAERKAKLQQLDGNVRRTLQELQERELAVVAEETKVSTLKEETKRRMGMAVSQHEDATKREATEAEHRLELSRQRSQFLEEQCQKLETKLETQVLKVSVLQEKQLERRLPPEATASAPSDLSEELQRLRIQLREQQLKNEAIAASRDHFKRKVEDLCSRLGGTSGTRAGTAQTQPTTSAGTPQGPDLVSALRQVQEDLAKLADSWTETPKRTPASARSTQATPESTQKLIAMRGHAAQDPVRQEQHLAWLCSQRHELLESGLYGSGDPVLQALELKIAQAEAQLRAVKGAERR